MSTYTVTSPRPPQRINGLLHVVAPAEPTAKYLVVSHLQTLLSHTVLSIQSEAAAHDWSITLPVRERERAKSCIVNYKILNAQSFVKVTPGRSTKSSDDK